MLTKRQAEALQFIEDFIATHPYSPSIREVTEGIGSKSSSSGKALVDRLAAKGHITFEPGSHRTIRVVK